MRKMAFLLSGMILVLLSGVAVSGPGPGPLAAASDHASAIVKVQSCPRGQYFCPGRIAGCCPNGWGCGSTRCIAPKRQPVRYGNCYWDGTRPLCAGSCQNGFVVRKREGSGCITGSRVYCCEPMGSSSTP